MSKFLILHGTAASPSSNWFMWLKGVLIGKGHEVWLPQLPDSDKPSTESYNAFLLSDKKFVFDDDTTLIGHSSGAVEILSLVQNLPANTTVKAALLVSAFNDNLGTDSLDGLFAEPLDFEKIKTKCAKFTFVHSDDDPYVPMEQAENLAAKTDSDLIVFEGQGHFDTDSDPRYRQFPELLEFIDY